MSSVNENVNLKENKGAKVGPIKNTWGPLSLIILVPILLFSVLIKTNLISDNLWPNIPGLVIFTVFILYGFLSIKLSKKKFTGPTNVDGATPEYSGNGFEFWIFTVFLVTVLSAVVVSMVVPVVVIVVVRVLLIPQRRQDSTASY